MRLSCRLALVVFALTLCGSARAEYFWREPAFEDVPLRGPAHVHGALIYSQGRGISINGRAMAGDSYHLPPPPYVRILLAQGWDGFKLNRKWVADNEPTSIAALEDEIARVRAEGYRRIILAGQSYGAWLSVLAATRLDSIHAVISTAPGPGYGDGSMDAVTLSAQKLIDFADDLKPTRIAFFFFDGDYRETTGRGRRVIRTLAARSQDYFVVDKPAEFWGHSGAGSGRFARRYGDCLVRFVDPQPRPPGPFLCDTTQGVAAGSDIPLPADTGLSAPPPGTPPHLAAFVGRWYGEYENGAVRRFAVTEILPDNRLRADYGAAGPLLGTEKPFVIRAMVGSVDEDGLVFRDKVTERRFRANPDGTLSGDWRRLDGKSTGSQIIYRRTP